jgi:nitrogen fixation protein
MGLREIWDFALSTLSLKKPKTVDQWVKGQLSDSLRTLTGILDTEPKLSPERVKELISDRDAAISLYVLNKMVGHTFLATKDFTNTGGAIVITNWESINILEIDTQTPVNTLKFEVMDTTGAQKWEKLIYSTGVFFNNSKWCFLGIEEILEEASQAIANTL